MLIQACLNGATTREEHPAVPLTPAELSAEARAAAAAGAQAFHLHPRDPHGAQTLQQSHVLAAVAAVRDATGLPVGVTTGIAGCCARAASGQAAAPPMSAMKPRRFMWHIGLPPGLPPSRSGESP